MSINSIQEEDISFESEGIYLSGTFYSPKNPHSAVVLVHGSDRVPRMTKFARLLAQKGILVLTYDKCGVGESGGVYQGPEVGSNNISFDNLNLLAKDASNAIDVISKRGKKIPIGMIGASQAGWIIPIAAKINSNIDFMVLFSCPTITTLEQLRFQFYTDGDKNFWKSHTEAEAREHIMNDSDRYQFVATDPKDILCEIEIPGLWLFGEQDIQVPVKMCIEQLNTLKLKNKPFEYVLFPSLGHDTQQEEPIDIAINWLMQCATRH